MKINRNSFISAFGSIRQAALKIGVSRLTIYLWADQGFIPEIATRGTLVGTSWHKKLEKLGFNSNLTPIKAD